MDAPIVTVLSTSMLLPATPTRTNRFFLPSIDLCWQDFHYNQRLIFYHTSSDHSSQSALVHRLKNSLSLVLVHFYPWAGRLSLGHDGRVALDCNDAGVEFVEASCDVSFKDLEGDNFQPKLFFEKLCQRSEHSHAELFHVPLLSVQVTRFLHGGLALAFSQSHVIADGHSMWHFMVSWAECGRGVPISMPPLHNRAVFKLESPSQEIARMNFRPPEGDAEAEGDAEELTGGSKVLVQRLFHFSAVMIKKLKSMAAEEGRGTFTTYELLCAHFWRCVTKARRLKEKRSLHFVVLANCRNRLSEPLPPAYFGNVVTFGVIFATAGKLLSESLATTASRIHEAVLSCDEASLQAMMHWLELHNNRWGEEARLKGEGMNVASSFRFPVYEVDFGWGRPAAVRAVKVKGDGEMVLFPGAEGGGGSVDICMPLTPECMKNLQEDPNFLTF